MIKTLFIARDMRKSGRWMSIVDERILEYLDEHEFGSPGEIHKECCIDYSREYFSQRIRILNDHGLVQRINPNGVYRITENGENYLIGEYDARVHDDEKEADGGATVSA